MRRLFLALALLLPALSACAENSVRLSSASSVAQLSSSVIGQTRTYFAGIGQRRRESLVALLASDPHCRWANPVRILVPLTVAAATNRLCLKAGEAAPAGYGEMELELHGAPEQALQLAISELALIAAYQSALANALEEEPSRFAEDLFFALDLVGVVQTDLAKVIAQDISILSSDQVEAARGLITLVATLRREAQQVEDVRRIVAAEGGRVPTALTALRAQVNTAANVLDVNTSNQLNTALTRYYDAQAARLTFAERQQALTAIAISADGPQEARARIRPLLLAIEELEKGDRELREALAGNFSAEQRRAIAQLNRKRFLEVTSLIAGLVTR